MKRLRPIKKLVVNGVELSKLQWSQLDNGDYDNKDGDIIFHAYDLYTSSAYPNYLRRQLKEYYPDREIEIEIIPNRHRKYQSEIKNNPEWFFTEQELREKTLKVLLDETS